MNSQNHNPPRGFSLFEVLLTLCLISGAALGLAAQQWQMARLLNATCDDAQQLQYGDNRQERSDAF